MIVQTLTAIRIYELLFTIYFYYQYSHVAVNKLANCLFVMLREIVYALVILINCLYCYVLFC